MTIHTGAKTEGALKTTKGVEVAFRGADGQAKSVTADVLLVAVGRGPVTDGLGLESTKVQLDRGYIKVNEMMATDEPGDLRDRRRRDRRRPAAPAARARRVRGGDRRGGAAGRQGGRARQLRPGAGRHLLHAGGRQRRAHGSGSEEAGLRRQGRTLQLRQHRQAAHHRPGLRAGEGRVREPNTTRSSASTWWGRT